MCVAALGPSFLPLPDNPRMTLQVAATLLANRGVVLAECEAEPSDDEYPTPREVECARLAASGNTDWEIGHILGLHEGTVALHLDTLKVKLNITRRADIVLSLARLEGLVDEDG